MKDFLRIFYQMLTRRDSSFRYTFIFLLFSIILSIILVRVVLLKEESSILKDNQNIILLATLLLTLLGVLPVLVRYLSYDKKYSSSDDILGFTDTLQLKNKFELERKLNDLIKDDVTIEKIQKNVYDKTVSDIESTLLKKIEDKYEKIINIELKQTLINQQLIPIIRDTEKYIDKLQRNSVVNLIIGIIGTISSITILAITILGNNNLSMEIKDFLIHFLPRLTFVIFIQIFAFFFLRLYKNNLDDAKYFQNELTNLNTKTAALKIANLLNNQTKIDEILKELSVTERNFKLLKDETMQNIERAKIEKEMDMNMLNAFSEFLKTYKKE